LNCLNIMTSMILKRWPSSLCRVIPDRRICVDADGLKPTAKFKAPLRGEEVSAFQIRFSPFLRLLLAVTPPG
jgi:hypothetical protein